MYLPHFHASILVFVRFSVLLSSDSQKSLKVLDICTYAEEKPQTNNNWLSWFQLG